MNLNSIFTKSAKGMMELNSRSSRLPRDLLKVLKLVDGKSTVRQLADSSGSNPAGLLATMEKLEKDGYVKEFSAGGAAARAASAGAAAKPAAPAAEEDEGDDLDFTIILRRPLIPEPPDAKADEDRRRKEEAQRRSKEEAEARAREEAQRRAREDLERRSRIQAEESRRAEAERKAREEAERRTREEAERKAREAREDAERKAREAKEEAERKTREVAEKRARMLAEARKHIETMDARLAEANLRREQAAAALAKARAAADAEAKRVAEHRAKADADGMAPQALIAELGHAGTAAAAWVKALGEVLEQAQAQVQALADATKFAESRQKALNAQVEASTEAGARAKAIEQRSRGEQEIKEIGQARGTAESTAQALARKRDEAQGQAKALAEAAANAKAEAERRAKERAAALARLDAETRAAEQARTQAQKASAALAEAISRAEAASRAFEQTQRAAASGPEGEQKVAALEAAETSARAWASALGSVNGQGDGLIKALTEGVARSKARVAALTGAIAVTDDQAKAAELKDALDRAQAEIPALDKELSATKTRLQELAQAKGKAEREAARFAEGAQEARARSERALSERREREQREEAARREAEDARRRAQEEAQRAEAAARAAQEAGAVPMVDESLLAAGGAPPAPEEDNTLSRRARTFMSSVLFMDIVEYSTRPVSEQMAVKQLFNDLVADLIRDIADQDKVVVDTGDGAAVSFLGDPEDAFVAATKLSDALYGTTRERYKDLQVRIGINLGPLKVVRDMRDQVNLVGDGINDAQRVMAFAQPNQILASRAFYDVVARLSPDYANRFRYLGLRKDKHGRDHQIYEWSTPAAVEFQAMVASEAPSGGAKTDDLSGLAALGINVGDDLKLFNPETTQQLPSAAEIEKQLEREAQERARQQEEEEKRRTEEEARRKREEDERARQEELLAAQAEADRQMWEQAQARPAPPPPPPIGESTFPAAPGTPHAEAPVAPRRRRRKVPVARIAVTAVLAVIAGAIGLAHVVPLEFARSAAETALTARVGEPVGIDSAQGSLFPPQLTLRGIRVGADGALTAESATLPGISGLLGDVGELKRMRIENVKVSESGVRKLAKWNAGGSGAALPVEAIELRNVTLSLADVAVPAFDGELSMAADGKVQRIDVRSTDGRINGQLTPAGGGLKIQASAQTWKLPLGAPLTFDNLQVKATATPGRLDVERFDGLLFGGRTVGKGAITWDNSWVFSGDAELTAVDSEALLGAYLGAAPIAGALRIRLTLAMRGDSLKGLFGAPQASGDFTIERGALNSIDLSKALRTGAREGARGQTKFTDLTGTMALAQNRYAFTNLKLAAGLLSAAGAVEVAPDQSLSGRLNVEIASAANPLHGALTVGGTAVAPMVRP